MHKHHITPPVVIPYLGPREVEHICSVTIVRAKRLLHERLPGEVRVVLLQMRERESTNHINR